MEMSRKNSTEWKISLRSSELQTLVCAAKWILNGGKGRVPQEAKERLKNIVDSYQIKCKQLDNADKKNRTVSLQD